MPCTAAKFLAPSHPPAPLLLQRLGSVSSGGTRPRPRSRSDLSPLLFLGPALGQDPRSRSEQERAVRRTWKSATARPYRVPRPSFVNLLLSSRKCSSIKTRGCQPSRREPQRAKQKPVIILTPQPTDLSGYASVRVPTVALYFGGDDGTALTLPARNLLVAMDDDGVYCLAFAASASGLSIFSNLQQQGIQITVDSASGYLGFGPTAC